MHNDTIMHGVSSKTNQLTQSQNKIYEQELK